MKLFIKKKLFEITVLTYQVFIDAELQQTQVSIIKVTLSIPLKKINPCPAELLQLYFSSFEAVIANAISSFKWRKILLFMKNRDAKKKLLDQQSVY